jgi:predicted HicB family RNase H-like nuclease
MAKANATPDRRHITLRLTEEYVKRLEAHAEREERSLNQMIDFAVRDYVEKLDAAEKGKGKAK